MTKHKFVNETRQRGSTSGGEICILNMAEERTSLVGFVHEMRQREEQAMQVL